VSRDRRPVLITDVAEDPEKELRRREIRYVAMMMVRALCLVGGAILVSTKPPLWGLWVVLCVVGMVFIPWLAVILANDRPAKSRAERAQAAKPVVINRVALPAPPQDRVIDAD
jgi:arginine exporter protein ArgO